MFDGLQFAEHWDGLKGIVDDTIRNLLKKLLATDDVVEFDALSSELRSMLHERIEQLRNEAKSLKPRLRTPEQRKHPRNGATKL